MLYGFLKIWVKLAMRIFCRRIIISNRRLLHEKGPLLLAANHPNSFLDAVILETLFEQPVYSLARGDAFVNKPVRRILSALKILPVYRTTEGVENLSENYKTFAACKDIFRQNGVVLIFSEGKCINEWHLRSLKKGTARLAFSCWDEDILLNVLPVAVNYNSFRRSGKNIFIHFGKMITAADFNHGHSDGLKNNQFNAILREELEAGVFEIEKKERSRKKQLLSVPVPFWKKLLLFLPALAGLILHAPLFLPLKAIVYSQTKDNDHYDSFMVGLLLVLYPLYILLFAFGVSVFLPPFYAWLVFPVLPFTAWAYIQLSPQTD